MNKNFNLVLLLSFFISHFSFAQITLSGKAVRHNGDPIAGVMITCTNASPVVTGADGSFTFVDLPAGENYNILGSFESDFFEGISILDIAFSRELILFTIEDPIGFHWWAGDVSSGAGGLSTYDLVLMRKAILKIDFNLLEDNWLFFDEEGPDGIPSSGITLNNVTEDITDLKLVGIKLGDPAIDADHMPPPPSAPQPEYFRSDFSVVQGEQFTFDIRVNDFEDIVGLQHGLKWDPNLIEFNDYENSDQFDFLINADLAINGDFLITAYNSQNAISLNDSSVLYSINFTALEDINSINDVINFSSELILAQTVYKTPEWLYLVESNFDENPTSSNEIASLQKFDLLPNPAQNEVLLNIGFDQVEKGELVLYDITGKQINSWGFSGSTFQRTIDIQHLSKGTYILKVITENGLVAKRLVKQ